LIGQTFAHYVAVALGAGVPHTQTSKEERDLLTRHLPGRKRIVEVGVFEGFTTRVLVDASDPDAVLYGVDPFFPGRLGICWGELIAKRYNGKPLSTGKLQLVRALSVEVGTRVPETVDFVFIDADHSLQGITSDWDFWSRRVDRGGIIALHDTVLLPGRSQASELGSHQYFRTRIRHDARFDIVAQVDSLSILSKR
jgi:predicted O-methyltransferase YrrM